MKMTGLYKLSLILLASTALCGAVARGQGKTLTQADIEVNFYGALNGMISSNNTPEKTPSNSVGGMIEFRFIRNPLLGFEATYSYSRPSQTSVTFPVGTPVGLPPGAIYGYTTYSTTTQQITGDWVFSKQVRKLRPFPLAGIGGVFTGNSSSMYGTQSSANLAYVYGVGLDWRLLSRVGLRLQYRGNIYKLTSSGDIFPGSANFSYRIRARLKPTPQELEKLL